MTPNRPVIVKRLAERVDREHGQELFQELRTALRDDRPSLVFDFSDVSYLDSAGIEIVLKCMEEAMKRNGDLKFAAVPPAVAAILRLMRVDCLFEIFEDVSDAVESFYRFPSYVFPQPSEVTHPIVPANADRGTRHTATRSNDETPK
jgi:anti-sigma B factor antagonist